MTSPIAPPPPTARAPLPPLHLLRAGQRVPVAWGYSTVLPDWDVETYSEAGFILDPETGKYSAPIGATKKGLPAVGSTVYYEDASVDVICLAYDLKDGQGRRRWKPGQPLPQELIAYLQTFNPLEPLAYLQPGVIEAHNSGFELRCAIYVLHHKYGWPKLHIEQMRCSMAKARAFSLPGALGQLAQVLGSTPKNPNGDKLIKLFSVPQNRTKTRQEGRVYATDKPLEAAQFEDYNEDDIIAEADASRRLPDLIPQELDYWLADQRCNWRGVGVDLESVQACIAVLDQAHSKYNAELYQITGGAVARASEISKLQEWVSDQTGYRMKSGDTDAVDEAIRILSSGTNAPHIPHVLRALEIRNLIGSAAVKKVYAMARMATADSRLCDLFNYHGARTGRDTHADVQPGNLPKSGPKIRWCGDVGCGKPYAMHNDACPWCGASSAFSELREKGAWDADAVEDALHIMRFDSLELVEYFFGDAVLTISGCVRSLLCAGPGKELLCSDYSAIEAVVLAVLAGEQWRIDAFHRGESIYYHGAAGVTGKPYQYYVDYKKEHGSEHPDRNKIGKVCLGPETLVLTHRGYLRIVDVSLSDKLWDGVEWVSHQGLLNQGTKDTMLLDGVRITPEHLVNMSGSWMPASKLGSNESFLCQALVTGSVNLPWSKPSRLKKSGSDATAGLNRTRLPQLISEKARALAARLAEKSPRPLIGKCSMATPTHCPTTSIGVDFSIGYQPPSGDAITLSKSNSTAMEGGVFEFAKNGIETNGRSYGMFSSFRAGTTRLWKWIAKTAMATMNPEIFGSSRSAPTHSTSEKSMTLSSKSNCSGPSSIILSQVYDLANAGPRHRFTIKTDSGHLIVHNCELALGFMGWVGAWRNFDKTDNFTDDEVKELINKWRAASPMLAECAGGQVRGKPWRPDKFENYGYEGMFLNAVLYPGQVFAYRGIEFQVLNDILFVKLLSGRRLTYHSPRAERTERFQGVQTYALSYMTWNSNPGMGPLGWTRMETYAGRLVENIVQATARDLMAAAVVRLESNGYPVVMRVHDEIVSEVDEGYGSEAEFESLMAQLPDWAAGWPVRCGGTYRAKRYKK